MRITTAGICVFALLLILPASAQNYPQMVGLWAGTVRVVSSGNIENDRLDQGGVIISEVELELHIDAQDRETFVGRSRTGTTPDGDPGTHVWGSIRSTGDEALFITEGGSRGHLWFTSGTEFEYCLTNLNAVTNSITSYCARMLKQQ